MFDILFLNSTKKNCFFSNMYPPFKTLFFKSSLILKYGSFYNFFIFYFLFNFLFGVFPFSYKIDLKKFDLNNLDAGFFKIIFFYNSRVDGSAIFHLRQNINFTFLSNFNLESTNLLDFPFIHNFNFKSNSLYINFFNMWDIFYLFGLTNIKNYIVRSDSILNFCLTLNKNNYINLNETS